MMNSVVHTEPGQVTYRCRKCRQDLGIDKVAVIKIEGCDWSTESNIVYLNIDSCPAWITAIIEDLYWTKGKLCCFVCSGRLGSFDFVHSKACYCKQHVLPPLQLVKNRIDIICKRKPVTQPAEYDSECVRPIQPCQSVAGMPEPPHGSVYSDQDLSPSVEMLATSAEHHASCDSIDIRIRSTPNRRVNESMDDIQNDATSSTLPDLPLPQLEDNVSDIQIKEKFVRKRELRRRKRDDKLEEDEEGIEISNSFSALGEFIDPDNEETIESTNPFSALQELADNDKTMFDHPRRRERRSSSSERRQIEIAAALEAERDSVPYEWMCCICMELYHHPQVCEPCQHVYCDPCLRLLAKNVHGMQPILCPLCRKLITNCKPEKDMWIKLKEKFLHSVTDRTQRVRALGLKSTPLPKLLKPPVRMPYGPLEHQIRRRGQIFNSSPEHFVLKVSFCYTLSSVNNYKHLLLRNQ